MSAMDVVDLAVSIVEAQTKRIRRFLRHNRNRVVYRVEGNDGKLRNVYSKVKAVLWLNKHGGGWMFCGEQNARWIDGGNLTGIRWKRRRVWYLPPPSERY